MKRKQSIVYIYYLFLTCYLGSGYSLIAQNFERIESEVGLSMLEQNNGVAVADYDNDLDLDIFVVAKAQDKTGSPISHSRLFRNTNGIFEDVTEISGLVNLFPEDEEVSFFRGLDGIKFGVSWGDYDNDGFPDIFFTHSFKVQLFHNEGDGTFIEKTIESGIQRRNNCRNAGATWFDVNNDGYLDLYISDWGDCENNPFYINNGDGTFRDVTEQFGHTFKNQLSYMSVPFDFNNDGWMDLLVTNDFDQANNLFINENGIDFTDQATNYGVDNKGDDMGVAIGDYNNDGLFDFYITNINENILLKNNGNRTFTDVAEQENMVNTGWAWDCNFSDFDLDGDEDLFAVNGFNYLGNDGQYNVYFKNLFIENNKGFSEVSEEVNFNAFGNSVGGTPFDFDDDGDLDIFLTNNNKPSYFYKNQAINNTEPSINNWLKVALQGTISNRNAVGTRLSLTTNEGTIHRYYTGLGFLSQSIQPVHFGMGSANAIIELKIFWPSGLVETYDELLTNSTFMAVEGSGNEITAIIKGCTDPNSCTYNPKALVDDGSCTYLEIKSITGAIHSGFLTEEVYNYPSSPNSQFIWEASGGEIIEGQGSSRITIRWGLENTGKVSVTEINPGCSSPLAELDVELTISQISDNTSLARIWNEALLQAIRGDYARPTIHARNLFHTSIAMYDAWALYNEKSKPYLIGNELSNYENIYKGFKPTEPVKEARKKTLSYAVYRLLTHRFQNSPKATDSKKLFDLIMSQLGYDVLNISTDYSNGDAAALGNFIAESIIAYGYADGSGEENQYTNAYYQPLNPELEPILPGNEILIDPNRWQPLSLESFIDQSGNLVEGNVPEFLSPEWGNVTPFALDDSYKTTYQRSGNNYIVYHDPKSPPNLNITDQNMPSSAYKWGFSLVSIWGAHLDPYDSVTWDISPKSIGNISINSLPETFEDYPDFYNEFEGGDIGEGYVVNPYTNAPYESQIVPRGDYTRVLAEFWADGPDSETPPGHWYTLLNYVSDHELFVKKFNGIGETLDPLEWDVKSYFIMGGAMHDAAITAWSIKGWYDYIRPISAIRYMADKGQSSDVSKDNYDIAGIPLKEGYVELVEAGDVLAGDNNEHVGKIKLYTWRGHSYIENPATDQAGVDWILAENWWPYQRPTFVTPPFAGYVSGHSTYSRAAAEVMTLLTGDAYFPGGLGEFVAKKNEFLVFEEGPSVDVKLQWATYRDASDQCSLSRIWGGIHPPADDIPGRLIGEKIGKDAFHYAKNYFQSETESDAVENHMIYPNPITSSELFITNTKNNDQINLFDISGRKLPVLSKQFEESSLTTRLKFSSFISSGIYILEISGYKTKIVFK